MNLRLTGRITSLSLSIYMFIFCIHSKIIIFFLLSHMLFDICQAFEIEDMNTKGLIRSGKGSCLKPKLLEILLKSRRHKYEKFSYACWTLYTITVTMMVMIIFVNTILKLWKLKLGLIIYLMNCRIWLSFMIHYNSLISAFSIPFMDMSCASEFY